MTRDGSDGAASPGESAAAAALVQAIRARVIEYKELLLRQLMDQRVALLAIDDVAADAKAKRVAEERAAPEDAPVADEPKEEDDAEDAEEEDDEEDEDMEDDSNSADVEMATQAEAETPDTETNGHADPVAAEEQEDEEPEDDRKRRATVEPVVETPAGPASSTEEPEAKREEEKKKTPEVPTVVPAPRVVKRIRRESFHNVDHPPPPVPGGRAVVRSSTPPRRYLGQRDEFLDDTHLQLVLRTPTRPQKAATTTKPRAASSLEDVQAEFDQKLRVTMRLQRDVNRRSVAVTRKRQLPRLPTPARSKSHWDYLLEEMRWMAMDFSQERNWKRGVQWHLAKDVVVARNAERVRREKETRQLAKEMAMQVAAFWRTMERIAARSQVRFEGGAGGNAQADRVDEKAKESEKEDSGESAGDSSSGVEDDVPVLRFKSLEVESSEDVEAKKSVETRLQEILSKSRRARSALSASVSDTLDSERERAIQRVLEIRSAAASAVVSTSAVLATFQIVALRWMLELCLSGCNVLLNDQVGMGQSATIAAFLSVLEELRMREAALDVSHPHLVIVPADELHKWCFFLREWNQSHGLIQLYNGSLMQRKRLQAEWVKKLTVPQFFSSDDVADLEKEDTTPLFAVVCSAEDFASDHDAFRGFPHWQTIVVEVEQGGLRDEDCVFVQSLSEVKHSGRRVVTCSQPLEAWPSSKTRAAYAEFLIKQTEEDKLNSASWTKGAILEKASAAEVVRWFGNKTGSTALLKSQQEHLSALTVAMQCLSLRRLRSEVESELGKLEETSVACALSSSQQTQYRHAITAFAASSAADRITLWLQLVLKLRSLCNCVDVLNDAEKLALADIPFLLGCSGKLQQLHELITRVVAKERRRVVVYCQLDAMLNVVEMLLALMDIQFVYVTGSVEMQRRALCHFALRPAVQVALVSTRLACLGGKQAMPVYGADAVVVLDSDWQATCDAKLRASWAKCLVGNLPVFRFHCDATIEAALLRSGSCFSEKVFSEMGPQELLAATDGSGKIEKPAWWVPNGVAATTLAEAMAQVETSEQYCDSTLANALKVVNVELDAEEHLLLANADELTPVEWYAVNYLASSSTSEKKRLESEQAGSDGSDGSQGVPLSPRRTMTTLEQLAVQESRRVRQEVEVAGDMFYDADGIQNLSLEDSGLSELMLESVLRLLRAKGLEPHYEMVRPPQPPLVTEIIESEPVLTSENTSPEMLFKVSYREPAPPAPPPSLILKLKTDATTAAALAAVGGTDASGKPLKVKKRNKDLAGRAPGAPGATGTASGTAGGAGAGAGSAAGVKRKHDASAASGKPPKEPRLDFDGIPLPSDMAEFADDDFWGDTNLDALDSAAWDDPAVLSGILGPTLDVPPSSSGSAATAASGSGATAGQTTKKKNKSGAAAGGAGATAQGGAGRARKGSMSESNKDGGWQVQDDLVLKKLFEMYGSNWTLIAHVFNAATSVSTFVVRKRTPRQCYDRYGKIISSGSLTSSGSSGLLSASASPTKDGSVKSTSSSLLKQHKLNAAAAALWTPQVLAERIGLPTNEMLLVFSTRDSLPGLPPPSIVNVPSLAELTMKKKKKKQHGTNDAVATPGAPVLDDLKSIRTSFDAILQCMKRKTPPPPIPIPQASTVPANDPSAAPSTAASPSKASIVTPVPTSVPPPHKSHMDLVELLPRGPLTPEEVIKRSKEAAAVAVQAAAAVASAGRSQEISPLASAGDVMMNAAFGSNSAAAIAARKAGATTIAGGGARPANFAAVSATASAKPMGMSASAGSWGDPAASALTRPPHAAPPLPHPAAAPGLLAQPARQPQQPVASASSVNGVVSAASTPSTRGMSAAGSPAMPVTTSALLHVLDRMPEIKHKIQAILNRTDCSEAQKVAMIARLLSNTNAINATAVAAAASGNLSAAVSATLGASSAAPTPTGSATASTAGSGPPTPAPTDLASGFGQSLDTPIPMPASLASDSTGPLPLAMPASVANAATSSAMSDAALASALADTDMSELP